MIDVEKLIKTKKIIEIVSIVLFCLAAAVITAFVVYAATQVTLEALDYIVLISGIALALFLGYSSFRFLKIYDKYIAIAKAKTYTLNSENNKKKSVSNGSIAMFSISALMIATAIFLLVTSVGKPLLDWKYFATCIVFAINCLRSSALAIIDDKINKFVTFN